MNTNSTKDIKGGAGFFCRVSIAVPSGIVHSPFQPPFFILLEVLNDRVFNTR